MPNDVIDFGVGKVRDLTVKEGIPTLIVRQGKGNKLKILS
jgi:hypothetical protein